jgi:hypothetical protein
MGLSPGKSSKDAGSIIPSGRSEKITNLKVKTSSQNKIKPIANHASDFSSMFGNVTDIK